VQSQRYVAETHFEYVIPPEIDSIPEARAEFLAAMEEDQLHYEKLTALNCLTAFWNNGILKRTIPKHFRIYSTIAYTVNILKNMPYKSGLVLNLLFLVCTEI
jgi:hypothetical protein